MERQPKVASPLDSHLLKIGGEKTRPIILGANRTQHRV